ncbi:AB-hydrolase YheT [Mucidula mucida]|nr:AB-hydrolase YheT [Mucidula mucida]
MSSKIFFPSSPASVKLKDSDFNDGDLRTALTRYCPAVLQKFTPPWWLSSGHLQTIYVVTGNFRKIDRVVYHRIHLGLLDGGTLGLDFAPLNHQTQLKDDTPIVVVLPGLTGGCFESYVRSVLSIACAPVDNGGLGYRGVVINARGCGGVPITSQQWYSGGCTDDFQQALMYLAHRYPDAPLLGLGFSVGANVLMKYLGEARDQSRIPAACVLGCPWNLSANNVSLKSTLLGRFLYSRGLTKNLMTLLKRNAEGLSTGPDTRVSKAVNDTLALKNPRLDDFDRVFTSQTGGPAPLFPFDDILEYYKWASSHTALPTVEVPLLTINAADDPIVRKIPAHVDNPYLVMVVTAGGGHLGWFGKGPGLFGTSRWVTKPVVEWLEMAGERFVLEKRGAATYIDKEGFVRVDERDDLGCKVVPGGGIVDENVQNALYEGKWQGL